MKYLSRALEVSGTLDREGNLHLDEPVTAFGEGKVKVIVLNPDSDEISEAEWLRFAATNPVFDFLNDPEEDVYTLEDGKPIHHDNG